MKSFVNIRNISGIMTLAAILYSMSACAQYDTFDQMATEMANSGVPTIKVSDVKQMKDEGKPIVLLDAREEDEYKVSHIEDAIHVGYDYFNKSYLKDIPKDSKIIIYCSVGYRSGKIGEKLIDMGFSDVYNLYGGIFDWVNNGYTVVDPTNQTTEKIHSYNENWGKWLTKGKKVH